MSKGLRTRDLPRWIRKGIESAFKEWMDMSGEWLNSAPEYLVTVHIAQQLRKKFDANQRSIFLVTCPLWPYQSIGSSPRVQG